MKELILLIGASGSGKSTIRNQLVKIDSSLQVYSWDELRLEYSSARVKDFDKLDRIEKARVAYDFTFKESGFQSFLTKRFHEVLAKGSVLVDNTNTSIKRRAMFIEAARAKNYNVIAYVFPISRAELLCRADTRTDQRIPHAAIMQHYDSIQYPGFGEVDEIHFVQQGVRK